MTESASELRPLLSLKFSPLADLPNSDQSAIDIDKKVTKKIWCEAEFEPMTFFYLAEHFTVRAMLAF